MLWENTFEPRSLCYLKSYARGETELEPPVVGLDDTGHWEILWLIGLGPAGAQDGQ